MNTETNTSTDNAQAMVIPDLPPGAPKPLPNESAFEYQAFVLYYRMGPRARLTAIAEIIKAPRRQLSDWRVRWKWDDRLREHFRPPPTPDLSAEWAEKHQDIRQTEWHLHLEMIEAAREALERFHASDRIPSLGEITRIIEMATRLARTAASLPLQPVQVQKDEVNQICIEFGAALDRIYGKPAQVLDATPAELSADHPIAPPDSQFP